MNLKTSFYREAAAAAKIEVEDTCRQWKANEFDRRTAGMEAEIAKAAKEKSLPFFLKAAEQLGLQCVHKPPPNKAPEPAPTPGDKQEGTSVAKNQPTAPRRQNPPWAAKRSSSTSSASTTTSSPPATPRGRPTSTSKVRTQQLLDPSPTPQPKRAPPCAPLQEDLGPAKPQQPSSLGLRNHTVPEDPTVTLLANVVQQAMAVIDLTNEDSSSDDKEL